MANQYAYLRFQGGVDWKDVNPKLLRKLNALGRNERQMITVTSGFRTVAEQQYLWDNATALGLVRGVTVAKPGESDHQHGTAVDATVNGQPIGQAFSKAAFVKVGLKFLPKDTVHVTFLSSKEGGKFTPSGASDTGATSTPAQQTAPVDPALVTQQQDAISQIPQIGGAPLAQPPLSAAEGDFQVTPQSSGDSTWQLIASQGQVSQDTIRLAQLASLSGNGSSQATG